MLAPARQRRAGDEEGMFWHLVARKYPNCIVVETAEDIRRAKREGKAAFLMAAQGGDFIGNKLHRIEAFHKLGLRMMLPAYNTTNGICDGARDRPSNGPTPIGQTARPQVAGTGGGPWRGG